MGRVERRLLLRLAAGPAYYRELRRLVNGAGGGFVRALRRLECEGLVGWKYVVRRVPRRRSGVTTSRVKLYFITRRGLDALSGVG